MSFPVGNIVPLKSEVIFPSGKLGILRALRLPTQKYEFPSPMEHSIILIRAVTGVCLSVYLLLCVCLCLSLSVGTSVMTDELTSSCISLPLDRSDHTHSTCSVMYSRDGFTEAECLNTELLLNVICQTLGQCF